MCVCVCVSIGDFFHIVLGFGEVLEASFWSMKAPQRSHFGGLGMLFGALGPFGGPRIPPRRTNLDLDP